MANDLNDDWSGYLDSLRLAEELHDALNPPGVAPQQHPKTLCLSGTGHLTADVIEMRLESRRLPWTPNPYPNQGFIGSFRNAEGNRRQAILQEPAGDGDATVVLLSAIAINTEGRCRPGDRQLDVEHQPAFEDDAVQEWAIDAVNAIVKHRYYEQRNAPGETR